MTRRTTGRISPHLFLGAAFAVGPVSCADDGSGIHASPAARVQMVRGGANETTSFLGLDILDIDGQGMAKTCAAGDLNVTIEVSQDGPDGPWAELDPSQIQITCGDEPADVSLVLDNSGSQQIALDATRDGAQQFVDDVLAQSGRVTLTRVSTQAASLTGLTDESAALAGALEGLFVNAGWTALYDGVRLGNETMGATVAQETYSGWNSAGDFCASSRRRGTVLFTNGEDNNSADVKHDEDSDGIDTTFEDVKNLTVEGVTTPVYIVGLGKRVDADLLGDLAESSGGYYLGVDEAADLPEAFGLVSDYQAEGAQVCAELPPLCGQVWVRVRHSVAGSEEPASETVTSVHVDCPEEPAQGRLAATLLTLSNPGISPSVAATMTANTVAYVSPTAQPSVLVVRDDNHHGEFPEDSAYVADLLSAAGYDVDYLDEPPDGLAPTDVEDYDVLWFSNPGWPMDDIATFDVIQELRSEGAGVVLQGDDMGWSMGQSWSMSPLTSLDFHRNGTQTCGVHTDDNEGEAYDVVLETGTHPLIAGLSGVSFSYGDDIDHTTPLGQGEEVLAWASMPSEFNCDLRTPVIVAVDPQ